MRRFLRLTFAVLPILAGCVKQDALPSASEPARSIAKGTASTISSVGVLWGGAGTVYRGTGTLLCPAKKGKPTVLVTAKHVVDFMKSGGVKSAKFSVSSPVRFNNASTTGQAEISLDDDHVVSRHTFTNFNRERGEKVEDGLALLKIDSWNGADVEAIYPIQQYEIEAFKTMWVVGYGRTTDGAENFDRRTGELKYTGGKNGEGGLRHLTSTNGPAGAMTCAGDSGGPLIASSKTNGSEIVGFHLMTVADSCGAPKSTELAVATTGVADWIHSVTGVWCAGGAHVQVIASVVADAAAKRLLALNEVKIKLSTPKGPVQADYQNTKDVDFLRKVKGTNQGNVGGEELIEVVGEYSPLTTEGVVVKSTRWECSLLPNHKSLLRDEQPGAEAGRGGSHAIKLEKPTDLMKAAFYCSYTVFLSGPPEAGKARLGADVLPSRDFGLVWEDTHPIYCGALAGTPYSGCETETSIGAPVVLRASTDRPRAYFVKWESRLDQVPCPCAGSGYPVCSFFNSTTVGALCAAEFAEMPDLSSITYEGSPLEYRGVSGGAIPSPSPIPSPSAFPKASASPSVSPSPVASASPSPSPSSSPVGSGSPPALLSPSPSPSSSPSPSPKASTSPLPSPSAAAVATPSGSPFSFR